MMGNRKVSNHFGVSGFWLYGWLMVTNSAAMLLFGYDQGVFGTRSSSILQTVGDLLIKIRGHPHP